MLLFPEKEALQNSSVEVRVTNCSAAVRRPGNKVLITAAVDRSDRSRDRSIESIGSIDSIIFRSFKIFGNSSWRRCGSNGPKIIKIRAILAIFWPFEDFCRKIRRPYRRRRKQWGGSGGAEAPPGPSVVGSIGSIIRSVRSIIVQPTSVDRSGEASFTTQGSLQRQKGV